MSTLKEKIAGLDTSKFAEEFMKAQQNLREKFPTPESFLKLMKKMKDMTPEDREKFKESIGKNFKDFTKKLAGTGKTPRGASYSQYALFIGMVLLVVVVIGFFGRKLYRSIKDKEQKKERKPKKLPKTTQSPPASPQSKKQK